MRVAVFLILLLAGFSVKAQKPPIYIMKTGTVHFFSKAPQELIDASSKKLEGIIDPQKKTFAFKVRIISFMGFNNPLQREHFNENYMESEIFPDATFTGKIIEDIDLSHDGSYDVRAKGRFNIHGITQERIIKSHLVCKGGNITIHSEFIVPLSDHNIKIPRIVDTKLAADINVSVDAVFTPKT